MWPVFRWVNKGGNVATGRSVARIVKARLAQGTRNPAQGLRSVCSQ
jgi:hypothetical protein